MGRAVEGYRLNQTDSELEPAEPSGSVAAEAADDLRIGKVRSLEAVTGSLGAWLAGGVRTIAVDTRRAQGSLKPLKQALTNDQVAADRHGSWWYFPSVLQRHAIRAALDALPADQRRLVRLAYFGGYSNREIAAALGVSTRTVSRRLASALRKMLSHMDGTGRGWLGSFWLWLAYRNWGDGWSRDDDRNRSGLWSWTNSPDAIVQLVAAGSAVTVVAATTVLLALSSHPAPQQPAAHRAGIPSEAAAAASPSSTPTPAPAEGTKGIDSLGATPVPAPSAAGVLGGASGTGVGRLPGAGDIAGVPAGPKVPAPPTLPPVSLPPVATPPPLPTPLP